jgi:dihydrofolate reductase
LIVSQIAAMSRSRAIGVANKLPWDLPEDMKYFRDTTRSKIVIMGRKTFESMDSKPLPKRFNIVISRSSKSNPEQAPLVQWVTSIEAALELAKQTISTEAGKAQWGEEVFIIGGGEIFKDSLPRTDRIYLTEIDADFSGDSHFPEFSKQEFKLVSEDKRTGPVPLSFCVYQR